jgi:1-acyl-sn-glycerol-3-phosphate acyltransferase
MLLRFIVLLGLVLSAIIGIPMGIFESYTWLWALPLMAVGFAVLALLFVFLYVLLLCRRVDRDQEQTCDDPHYRWVQEMLVESILPVVRVTVKASGVNKVPSEGRFMLVCNHVQDLDPAPIFYALPGRQLCFVAKKEVRDMFIIGPVLQKLQGQFINRGNDREALKTILSCIRILKEDKGSIAVFPEGGIHDDRNIHRRKREPGRDGIRVCRRRGRYGCGHSGRHDRTDSRSRCQERCTSALSDARKNIRADRAGPRA